MARIAAARLVGKELFRRTTRLVLLTVAALLAVTAFIVGTPLLLAAVSHIGHGDWVQFSNEGQSYGGIAAIFGMLALVGVGASLILQSRQTAANRELTQRTIHTDLLGRALNDPELRACWGPSRHGNDEHDRQHIYTNMIVQYWRSMFEIGKVTEDQLHALSAHMFASAPGRRYWSIAGPFQKSHYLNNLDRNFIEIINDEYAKSKLPNLSLSEQSEHTAPLRTLKYDRAMLGAVTFGLICGAVLTKNATAMQRKISRAS